MPAPDMRLYLQSLVGQTVFTVAQLKPNTIVEVGERQVLVRTETDTNPVSIAKLQEIADRVFAGEIVQVETRGRSAFYVAVLVTLPGVAYALNPRRVWLEGFGAIDSEFDDLDLGEAASAVEGRLLYRAHRLRERSTTLARSKKADAVKRLGRLACECCDMDYAQQYGELGEGYIECHHRAPLADGGVRETTLADLALVCASCHRMLHRSLCSLRVDELRARIAGSAL
jgi:hypothetical protein